MPISTVFSLDFPASLKIIDKNFLLFQTASLLCAHILLQSFYIIFPPMHTFLPRGNHSSSIKDFQIHLRVSENIWATSIVSMYPLYFNN